MQSVVGFRPQTTQGILTEVWDALIASLVLAVFHVEDGRTVHLVLLEATF